MIRYQRNIPDCKEQLGKSSSICAQNRDMTVVPNEKGQWISTTSHHMVYVDGLQKIECIYRKDHF